VDANSNAFIEFDQKPQPEKQFRIIPPETPKGEIQPPAEIKNHVIGFQKTQENRLVNQVEIHSVNLMSHCKKDMRFFESLVHDSNSI
jgi:hypothetical protein